MSRHHACVSCGSSARRSKLISCLHAVCVPCLEQHVQYDGSIKCPKCLAQTSSTIGRSLNLLLSLPNVPAGEVESGGRGGEVITCDECAEKESAVARCADCNIHLCDAHGTIHPRSRATHNHQVTPLADGEQQDTASQPLTLHHCALHPSQLLTHFCMQCSQLLCQRCVDTGSQKHSQHEISSIDEAAVKMRETVGSNLHSCVSDSDGVISHAMGNVKVAIQTLHDDAEAASQEIADYFKPLKAALEAREQTLLDAVDQQRNKHVTLLENQLARLEEGVFHGQTVADLFGCCHDNTSFLRMWKWLNTAVDKRKNLTKNDAEPCTTSLVVFSGCNAQSVTEQVGQVGAVLDVLDVMDNVRVSADENTAYVDGHLTVAFSDDKIATLSQESIDHFQLSACDPEMKALAISSFHRSSSGRLEETCRPLVAGEHSVSVMVRGKHLTGSPLQVNVQHYKPVFDESRCHGAITISNEKHTIRKTSNRWRSVCSTPIPVQHGTSQLRVRLDQTQRACMFICACSSSTPPLDDVHQNEAEVFGWRGSSTDNTCNGGKLGQPWQRGDVIRLTLDHDKHTLTGLHERTGTTEVLENVTGRLYWYVALRHQDDQVTIL